MGNLVFQATLGGQVNLVGPNTASTYNLNVPAVSSTIATTSGTETLTNKTLTTPVINGFTGDTSVVNIGSNQFYKDTSGNIGVGVTPSAWGLTGLAAMQIKNGGLYGYDTTEIGVTGNAYYGSSAWRYIASAAATKYSQTGGSHYWSTAASGTAGNEITFTTAMMLDASGRLGIGTTSPATRLVVGGSTGNYGLQIAARTDFSSISGQLLLTDNTGSACMYSASGALVFATGATVGTDGGTERARIDSSGNLLVGKTSASNYGDGSQIYPAGTIGLGHPSGTGSGAAYALFGYAGGGIGSITQNGTTAVAYNTSSDYRLKHDIHPMTGALAKVAALKPCTYKWNYDNSDGEGFIAHELAQVCPHAVTGEKDAVDEDGNPKYQGIDTSFLVATLTAAIQEQQAIITQLQADVAALKG